MLRSSGNALGQQYRESLRAVAVPAFAAPVGERLRHRERDRHDCIVHCAALFTVK